MSCRPRNRGGRSTRQAILPGRRYKILGSGRCPALHTGSRQVGRHCSLCPTPLRSHEICRPSTFESRVSGTTGIYKLGARTVSTAASRSTSSSLRFRFAQTQPVDAPQTEQAMVVMVQLTRLAAAVPPEQFRSPAADTVRSARCGLYGADRRVLCCSRNPWALAIARTTSHPVNARAHSWAVARGACPASASAADVAGVCTP